MRALKQKAASEKGASITFALLLFLVCAIVSSVVIVAATAVGGRASKMAEMDRRYYAVNSAAELLRDVLEDSKVEVYYAPDSGAPEEINVIRDGLSESVIADDADKYLVTAAALNMVSGLDASYKPNLSNIGDLLITLASTSVTLPEVKAEPLISSDGLILEVYSGDSGGPNGTYSTQVTFFAIIQEDKDSAPAKTTVRWKMVEPYHPSPTNPGGA